MVDWAKKINKAVGGDIQADEQLEAGLFVQPGGMTSGMMGREMGGIVGGILADKMSGKRRGTNELVTDEGVAAGIPKGEGLVLGITGRRFLVWGHSKMSGKPKDLKLEMPLDQVAGIDMKKGKVAHSMIVVFSDETGVSFEAPKIGKPDTFMEAFARLTG